VPSAAGRRAGKFYGHAPAVTGLLIGMISSRANIHLLVGRAYATSIEVTERRVVDFVRRFVSEAHLQDDGGIPCDNCIVYPTSKMIGEYEFVSVRLIGVNNIRSGSCAEHSALIARIVSFYECIESIVVKCGDWNLLETVNWMNIQRWTSSDIPVLHFKGERHSFGNLARKVGIRRCDPSTRTGNQRFARESVRFDHLTELAGINECYFNAHPKDEQFNNQLPRESFPPWLRWRTAIFALIVMFGGITLVLWLV
jgi:hypothetical protein